MTKSQSDASKQNSTSEQQNISQAEFDVLDALWQGHPASANDIVERLNQQKDWHEKTVKTLLGRLVKKGVISFQKEQRRYLYTPLIERETYRVKESESLISRLFGGKLSPLVAGFADRNKLSQDDVDELKKLIKTWEQEND